MFADREEVYGSNDGMTLDDEVVSGIHLLHLDALPLDGWTFVLWLKSKRKIRHYCGVENSAELRLQSRDVSFAESLASSNHLLIYACLACYKPTFKSMNSIFPPHVGRRLFYGEILKTGGLAQGTLRLLLLN